MTNVTIPAVLAKYNDFQIVGRDLTMQAGLTLVSLVHDEMYFLPAFLEHYRKLGIKRFVFVDDRSTDGSAAFLAEQPDVMVVHSQHRFGDRLTSEDSRAFGKSSISMNTLWRQLLLAEFCMGQWAMCVDIDEFVDLPSGMTFADLAKKLEEEDVAGAWSVMLDMYPGKISDLEAMSGEATINLAQDWYYDGQPHLKLHAAGNPELIYSGARARLLQKYGLNHRVKPWKAAFSRALDRPAPFFNDVHKPVLLHWSDDAVLSGPHSVNLGCSQTVLLPMRHYKLSGETYRRIDWALQSKGYAGGSVYYSSFERLLRRMAEGDAPFTYARSRHHKSFDDFVETGNALGFD